MLAAPQAPIEMKIGIQLLLCFYLPLVGSVVCQAQQPELVVQTGHSGSVYSVAFSPDGKLLASGGMDSRIRLWDVATGQELRTLSRHSGSVNSVVFNVDGQTLASGSSDRTIKLWQVATGQELLTLRGHTESVNSIALSPDSRILASGSNDKTIKLWDVATGRELRTLIGHSGWVSSIAFSPDGKRLVSGSYDATVQLWDVATGRKLQTLVGHSDAVLVVTFSPDGKTLASGSKNKIIKLWDAVTGLEIRPLMGHSEYVRSVAFSIDGQILASGSGDMTIKLWQVATGRELHTLSGHPTIHMVHSVVFSPDGMTLASGSRDSTIRLWEVSTGREQRILGNRTSPCQAIVISPDGKTLAGGSYKGTIQLWDLATTRELRTFSGGHSGGLTSLTLAPDSKTLASGSEDGTIKLWDVATGRELGTLRGVRNRRVFSVAFSPDGKTLASGGDLTIKLWDVATGGELRTLAGHRHIVYSVGFSFDGTTLVSGSADNTINLWDLATGRVLRTFTGHSAGISSVALSADGKILISGSHDGTVKLWDVLTGDELRTLTGHTQAVTSVALSLDGRTLASGSSGKTVKLWDVATGRELRTLSGHSREINSVAFSPNGKFLVSASRDGFNKLWRVENGQLLANLIALDETDWAVVAPDGRFDASQNAQKLMHWMVGNEPIELEQLKEGYYEPGLLAKLTGFNKEPLRGGVSGFSDVKLFPDVDYQLAGPKSTKLNITLTNRGGGIGPVQVFVNDKELIDDARPPAFNPNQAQANLTVDLSGASAIPGHVNEIRVVVRNQQGYLSSRGTKLVWTPAGSGGVEPPDLYAIVVGTSTYQSPALELRYAAKDAGDMARALELGAKRLFGAERVHLQLLTSDKNNPRAIAPTKSNISKAFEQVRKARPQDIFVVYFAGHGVTLQGKDNYLYLTQEARTTDSAKLANPLVLEQTTISSEELVKWIKLVPALKQVMILDTCAAGAAAGKLVEQRNVSGDQIRAIERLKDRTGFHVLMGSAADAVSYEASQYGQGVLTYALLQGMRGAALREEEYVDVQKLFQYAADEVPQLARNIGGLQRPLVAAPRGTSFDVGRIGRDEKALIPVTTIKPVILRPLLLNTEEQADTLDLIGELRKRLRDESSVLTRGGDQQPMVVYVDEGELPGAIRPSGTYTVAGDRVSVTMVLRRDGQRIATLPVVEGSKNDVAGLIDKIMKAISAAISGPLR